MQIKYLLSYLVLKYVKMNLSLKGKNALVCGSSKGIGKASAVELAALGANVTLVSRSPEKMSMVISEMVMNISEGQDHDFLVADFSDSADLRKKVKGLLTVHHYHILVNNTGGPAGGPVVDAKPEEFTSAFHNHLICNHILSTLLIPGMKKEGYGRIINIISTSVKTPIEGLGVSNTIRGAVASWSKTLSNEVAKFGITVNNVLPGFTKTERLNELFGSRAEQLGISFDEMLNRLREQTPVRRLGGPEEIGAAVAFLASPAAGYINGINLPVDGGRTPSL